jgi:hypothetical protein
MVNFKGVLLVVAGVGVISALVVAGLAVDTRSGAATDVSPGPTATAEPIPDEGPPPASPIEPTTDPATGPAGGPLADGDVPASLPDAGSGSVAKPGSTVAIMLGLLTAAGIALFGAGRMGATRQD